jgi:hypothetical protein
MTLDRDIELLEIRAEQHLIHYRSLDRHSPEGRLVRKNLRTMIRRLLSYRRQREAREQSRRAA